MMTISPNSRARREKERGEVKREYGGILGEEVGNADYRRMVLTTLFSNLTRGLRIVAAF